MRPTAKTAGPRRVIARTRPAPSVLAILLFLLVFALYSPSLHYELVDLDDISYISNNTAVLNGLSASSLQEAFALRDTSATMYMPLLWVSYMLDIDCLGASPDQPWGFHFTNVLLHAINAVLLLLLLLTFCKKPWRAFFFAALWALHPLRVESVAWVAERKDVLSGFFALLCLGSYLRAWQRAERLNSSPHALARPSAPLLVVSGLFYLLGLLTKPALTPLPFVLLLLDFWPLHRMEFTSRSLRANLPRLLLEKTPYFLMAGVAAYGTVWGHQVFAGKIQVPLSLRVLSVPMSFGYYLLKTAVPRNLTALYLPFSSWMPPLQLIALSLCSGILVLALTLAAWRSRKRAPHQLVGWLWFIGMLAPVCGLVPIPSNDVADRFTYLPAIGLSIALLFVFPSGSSATSKWRWMRASLALAVLTVLSALTLRQLPVWKNTASLYQQVLDVFPCHATALKNRVAQLIRDTGDYPQADALISAALLVEPNHWEANFTKAQCLCELESPAAARRHLLAIVPPTSRFTQSYWRRDIARYALMLGQYDEAIQQADTAMQLLPAHDRSQIPILHLALVAAFEKGDMPLALAYAHRFQPYADKTSLELLDLLPHFVFQWAAGYRRDAYAFFQRLITEYPERADILNNIVWALATASWSPAKPQEVLEWATRLAAMFPEPNPGILDTLAAAQANADDFETAARTMREALALLPPEADTAQLLFQERLASRLALYEQHLPYREEAFVRMYMVFFGDINRLLAPESR